MENIDSILTDLYLMGNTYEYQEPPYESVVKAKLALLEIIDTLSKPSVDNKCIMYKAYIKNTKFGSVDKPSVPSVEQIEDIIISFIDPTKLKKGYAYLDLAQAIHNLLTERMG